MLLEMTPDEMLATTRSVRRRLDFERPIDPATLKQCLELALQAPTGSLRQDWHFVVSTDADQCRAVGEVYKRVWNALVTDDYLEASAEREPDPVARASWLRMMSSARHLADKGAKEALLDDEHLRNGLNVAAGKITEPAVAAAMDLDYHDPVDIAAAL